VSASVGNFHNICTKTHSLLLQNVLIIFP